MLGAAGALLCLSAGMAAGSWMRQRGLARWRMLCAYTEALGSMRVLLEQERPAMPELLRRSAACVCAEAGAHQAALRMEYAAKCMTVQPLCSVSQAYAQACEHIAAPWEQADEKAAMEMLFRQLGTGTAAMREQAVCACLRKLKPLEEAAGNEAQRGGKLCMQLGILLGLMAGIALW